MTINLRMIKAMHLNFFTICLCHSRSHLANFSRSTRGRAPQFKNIPIFIPPQVSSHQIHAACASSLPIRRSIYCSYSILIKCKFCNVTRWMPPALDARESRPVRLPCASTNIKYSVDLFVSNPVETSCGLALLHTILV